MATARVQLMENLCKTFKKFVNAWRLAEVTAHLVQIRSNQTKIVCPFSNQY